MQYAIQIATGLEDTVFFYYYYETQVTMLYNMHFEMAASICTN